jgi:hypothetical protein
MSFLKTLLLALALATTCVSAHADVIYRFAGTTDSGSRAGEDIQGEFSFADVDAAFDGNVALLSFSLTAFGQTYTLADADLPAQALFSFGSFLGIDFAASTTSDASIRPAVALTAGFFDLSEAFFQYTTVSDGGFATLSFERMETVPEPSTAALLLIGVLGAGALRRKR